jgi:hypothetical protein
MFQTKVVEEIKTHILCSINCFPTENRALFWDNVKIYGRARHATDGSIMQHLRFACWLTKATDTHTEYVILIALLWQQFVHEQASVYYIDCLLCYVHLS